jgi:hypothetical protein
LDNLESSIFFYLYRIIKIQKWPLLEALEKLGGQQWPLFRYSGRRRRQQVIPRWRRRIEWKWRLE